MNKIAFAEFIILKARMSATKSINSFLYFLKALPIFKQHLGDKIYSYTSVKTAVAIFGLLLSFAKRVVTDLAAAFIVLGISAMFSPADAAALPMFVPTFVAFCVISALFAPKAYSPGEQLYIEVRIMHMDARMNSLALMFAQSAVTALCYYPSMLLMMPVTGCGAELLLLPLIWYASRLCVYAADLYFKTVMPRAGKIIGITVFLSSVAMPIITAVLTNSSPSAARFAVFSLAVILPAIPAAIYILGFKRYRELIISECTFEKISGAKQQADQNAFKDVELKSKQLQTCGSIKIQKRSAASYLTYVFYKRHTWLLLKPAAIISAVVTAVFAAATIIGIFVDSEFFTLFVQNVSMVYQLSVFILYLMSTGARACKAMFYNCDISLLRMPFYRDPKLLLNVFGHRLFMTGVINAVPATLFGLACGALNAMGGGNIKDCILLPATAFMLSVFFSVYHLTMYYLFQPYTASLETKNPFFSITNGLIYLICYALFQTEIPINGFAYAVLAVTVAAVAISLIAVYKTAPKRFRIK